MDGLITGENDSRVGISVIDNNDVEHVIEMLFDGKIKHHKTDEYPKSAAKRTDQENAHSGQARRFARWHVYRERGYHTLRRRENPDALMAGLLAITALSEKEFTEHFADIEAQLKAHYLDLPLELPFDDTDPDDTIIYEKDVYIQPDPLDFEPPVLEQFIGRFDGDPDTSAIGNSEIPLEEMDDLLFDVEAVSEKHVLHYDSQGNEQYERGAQPPLDRESDFRVELMTFNPAEVDSFQHYVVSHLAYQIRDCFLLMGLKPPAGFRVSGWGSYKGFVSQSGFDLYENYWSSEATIQSWEPY